MRPLFAHGEGVGGEVASTPHLPLLCSQAVVESKQRHAGFDDPTVTQKPPARANLVVVRNLVVDHELGIWRDVISATPDRMNHEARIGPSHIREHGRYGVNGPWLLFDQTVSKAKCRNADHVPALSGERVGDETSISRVGALDSVIQHQSVFLCDRILDRSGQIRKTGADRADKAAETGRPCCQVPWPVRWFGVGMYKLVGLLQLAATPNFFNQSTNNPIIIIRHVASFS